MNANEQWSLLDTVCGIASQVSDIREVLAAVLELAAKASGVLDAHGQPVDELAGRYVDYVERLANAAARAESLLLSLQVLAAARKDLEDGSVRLQQVRRDSDLQPRRGV